MSAPHLENIQKGKLTSKSTGVAGRIHTARSANVHAAVRAVKTRHRYLFRRVYIYRCAAGERDENPRCAVHSFG